MDYNLLILDRQKFILCMDYNLLIVNPSAGFSILVFTFFLFVDTKMGHFSDLQKYIYAVY